MPNMERPSSPPRHPVSGHQLPSPTFYRRRPQPSPPLSPTPSPGDYFPVVMLSESSPAISHSNARAFLLFSRALLLFLSILLIFVSGFVLFMSPDSSSLFGSSTFESSSVFPQYSLSYLLDSPPPRETDEQKLEKVLKDASMLDNTVILTTLNDAWAAPNSIINIFLGSFRIGVDTSKFLNHLIIVALDQKAYSRCLLVHKHCYALVTEGIDFSREAYFMTREYLKMMWKRIDFLRSVLEMGYNFVFTDADVVWFRDPFPHFFEGTDFQIACDHFSGDPDDLENIPNGGFSFVRSNDRSIEFYKFWYSSREIYPGLHDQDVLNRIKYDPYLNDIELRMKFLNTSYFGGFCEPSKDLNQVCTMHANCCLGLESKLHDLRIMIQDWKMFMSLPSHVKRSSNFTWRVPQNCSIESLLIKNITLLLDAEENKSSLSVEVDG